jgi:hypothetical protein
MVQGRHTVLVAALPGELDPIRHAGDRKEGGDSSRIRVRGWQEQDRPAVHDMTEVATEKRAVVCAGHNDRPALIDAEPEGKFGVLIRPGVAGGDFVEDGLAIAAAGLDFAEPERIIPGDQFEVVFESPAGWIVPIPSGRPRRRRSHAAVRSGPCQPCPGHNVRG